MYIAPHSQTLVIDKSPSFGDSIRNLLSNIFAPFQKDYRHWPWSQIGTIVIACAGSYVIYKYGPDTYRRYYMSSTRNFSVLYNQALHAEKERLFHQLLEVPTREEGRKIQVVEIGAAHGANMKFYPANRNISFQPNLVQKICFYFRRS